MDTSLLAFFVSIISATFVFGMERMKRRVYDLEQQVDLLMEEKKLRELVDKATKQKE